MNLYIELN